MTLPAVADLLPHSGRMVLLDELTAVDDDGVTCALTITDESLFTRQGRQRCAVCLEYMAQAAAAFVGMDARRQGHAPRIGYVVGARDVRFVVPELRAGARLSVLARIGWRDVDTATFDCRVTEGTEPVAEATLTVVQPE